MRKQILKDILCGCTPIAVGMLIALIFCLLIALCSCRANKVVERVEVPVVVTQEHTIESVRIDHVRDTLMQRDSIYHYVQGDTVLIEKWHYLQGTTSTVRVDTLIKIDSVEVPVEVSKETVRTEYVDKPLSWWQKTMMLGGKLLLALLAVGVAFGGMRLYGKYKKL